MAKAYSPDFEDLDVFEPEYVKQELEEYPIKDMIEEEFGNGYRAEVEDDIVYLQFGDFGGRSVKEGGFDEDNIYHVVLGKLGDEGLERVDRNELENIRGYEDLMAKGETVSGNWIGQKINSLLE